MKKVFIYILADPRKPEVVRYVGRTETPRTRHIQHCCESGRSLKNEWLESLKQDGFMPQMVIVEETTAELADKAERTWIARFAKSGELSNTVCYPKSKRAKSKEPLPASVIVKQVTDEGLTMHVLADTEAATIKDMLVKTGGNKLETARRLGIGRQTLYNKIKLYKLSHVNGKPMDGESEGE